MLWYSLACRTIGILKGCRGLGFRVSSLGFRVLGGFGGRTKGIQSVRLGAQTWWTLRGGTRNLHITCMHGLTLKSSHAIQAVQHPGFERNLSLRLLEIRRKKLNVVYKN